MSGWQWRRCWLGSALALAVLGAGCGADRDPGATTDRAEAVPSSLATTSRAPTSTTAPVDAISAEPMSADTGPATTVSVNSVPTTAVATTTVSTDAVPPGDQMTPATAGGAPATTAALPPPPSLPPPTVPQRQLPGFASSVRGIDADLAARMTGVSWHQGCPVAFTELRLVEVAHVGFDGHHHLGRLVVHADATDAITEAFRRMYDARFPIERVTLVDDAGGSDDAAMAANLTTAFNCRAVTGGTGWSEHSYGRAVDVNPLQNPYVSSRGTILPPGGRAYLDRTSGAVGMIIDAGPAVAAFDAVGWQWGGRWRTVKDYQHFSASGR